MDAIISIRAFRHIIPNFSEKTFKQQKDWLIKNGIIGRRGDVAPIGVGYRIPTQGLSSLSALRFVDVVPEFMGDTVILPEEFTTITGSDFDIDKLFINMPRFKDGVRVRAKGTNVSRMSDAEVDNLLIDSFLQILTTEDNMAQLKVSIDTATEAIKGILADIEGDKKDAVATSFEYLTPSFQN